MAFPFYQPAYQPAYYPMNYQNMQQPQAVQHQNSIIWVSGLAEAQAYPVAPNNAVALWEQSGKVIYLKSADATGKPGIRIYDLVERTETAVSGANNADAKTYSYASKDELTAVVDAVKGLANDIEQMKGDLYGVAGRKRKKTEVNTDDDE